MSKYLYPTIIGLEPPTKEMIIYPNVGNSIDVWICHAEHPDGTKVGQQVKYEDFSNIKGVASWLRFTNPDAMEKFGMDIVKFARSRKKYQNDVAEDHFADADKMIGGKNEIN